MEARQWVLGALDALRLELPNLGAERRRALRSEMVALLDALDRCHKTEDWEHLRRDLQSFGTRNRLRDVLDAGAYPDDDPAHVTRSGGTRGHDHSSPPRGRSASELSGLLRRLLGTKEVAPIETYPEVDAPEEVVEQTSFQIKVTARSKPTAIAGRKVELPREREEPVDLEVEVELPDDGALTASCQLVQPLRVPEALDSTTLVFELFAKRHGSSSIVVRFYQDGVERFVAQRKVLVRTVAEHLAATTSNARASSGGVLHAASERFVGLRLRVDERSRDADRRTVRVTLDGARALLRAPIEGWKELPAEASTLIVDLCRDLHGEVRLDEAEARALRIRNIGAELARTLLPEPVIAALANAPEGTELHIEAEDPWVPWEMASLGSAGFLGERFAVTRWLRSGSPWERLPGGRAVLVAPPSNPPLSVSDERSALRTITGAAPIELRTALETMKAMGSASTIGFFHFACHGLAEPVAPLGGRLVLEGGELRTVDVQSAEALAGALVFLNACETGIETRALSGHGGWANAFLLRAGAGAFMAPSWSVGDRVAALFARRLYQHLGAGKTVGEAARLARAQVRDHVGPHNPDRLAYAVYASPTARLATAEEGAS